MTQKSKSPILKSIMSEVDEQLAAIPLYEADGTPIEDSMHLDMYIDGVANISFVDDINRKHYLITKTIATILVFDEIETRKNEPTKEDMHG